MIFEYGRSWPSIKPSSKLDKRQQARANALIELYGLNKEVKSNGESDSRWIQKCKALKDAIDCRIDFEKGCISIDAILRTATLSGFFSIWYAIFKDVPSIRTALIEKPDFHILETNCVDEFGNLKERHSENT